MLEVSPTLGINERTQALKSEGRRICNFGFGESPFPTPPRMANALRDHAAEKAYLPVTGLPALRQAIVEHQARHTGLDPDRYDVIIGPGSKLILFAIQMAIPGDLLLPVPSWVSYSPQAALLGQRVIPVATELGEGRYGLRASDIHDAAQAARAAGLNPTKLLINYPNNPAGLTIDDATLEEIANVCRSNGIALISDEIYGRVSYDHHYRSVARMYPEGTIVTTGLSKHLSLGGWRLGVGLIPKGHKGLFETFSHIASETWSCVATPVQIAAVEAYTGHADIEAYIRDTTNIHSLVNGDVAQRLRSCGVNCPAPQGGFYSWPDFGPVLGHAFGSSAELAETLLNEAGIAALPGHVFGETTGALKLRFASCDYNGTQALQTWLSNADTKESGFTESKLASLAPGIDSALRNIEQFVARYRSAA